MGMLMSINKIIKHSYIYKEYEWEVIRENIPGKEIYPNIDCLHIKKFMRLKRLSDGFVYETLQKDFD